MLETESDMLAGFYTLSAAQIVRAELSEAMNPGGRYDVVPAVLLGRLALDLRFRGKGLGTVLLLNAIQRCLNSDIGAAIMVVEAKDQAAARFYKSFDFVPDPDDGFRLMVNMQRLRKRLANLF